MTLIPGHMHPAIDMYIGSDVVVCGRYNLCDDQLIAIVIVVAAVYLFLSVLV